MKKIQNQGREKSVSILRAIHTHLQVVVVVLFSPNGNLLVFLSSQAAVDSGVHTATNSLHSISWPADGVLSMPMQIKDVVQFSFFFFFFVFFWHKRLCLLQDSYMWYNFRPRMVLDLMFMPCFGMLPTYQTVEEEASARYIKLVSHWIAS